MFEKIKIRDYFCLSGMFEARRMGNICACEESMLAEVVLSLEAMH